MKTGLFTFSFDGKVISRIIYYTEAPLDIGNKDFVFKTEDENLLSSEFYKLVPTIKDNKIESVEINELAELPISESSLLEEIKSSIEDLKTKLNIVDTKITPK